jgi:hypothetical protein
VTGLQQSGGFACVHCGVIEVKLCQGTCVVFLFVCEPTKPKFCSSRELEYSSSAGFDK